MVFGKTTLLIEMISKWARGEEEFLGHKFIGKCPDSSYWN